MTVAAGGGRAAREAYATSVARAECGWLLQVYSDRRLPSPAARARQGMTKTGFDADRPRNHCFRGRPANLKNRPLKNGVGFSHFRPAVYLVRHI